jgi:hypothetical protein
VVRDPGPIQNLGYNVTSRDLPTMNDEERGDAPNSGFVSKALNGHPVLRFFATSGATLGAMFVLSKVTKEGGLKLAKTLQDHASINPEGFSSRTVKSLTGLRKELDQLGGVNRAIDGADPDQLDPYSNLVFESNGRLTAGQTKLTDKGNYFTSAELNQAGKGIESEPAAIWSLRDSIQTKMVASARRMPYELPALYVGQKALVDPIFGGREDKPKVNWYNPVDAVTDFVKESSIALATMILPFEAAGAAAGNARSSLHNFRQSMGDVARSSGTSSFKTKAAQRFTDLDDILGEVGHDLGKITNQALKISSQTSAGVRAATAKYYEERPNINEILHSVRNTRAREYLANSADDNTLKRAAIFGRRLAFGDGADGNFGYVDLIPGLRGLSKSVNQGVNKFKETGVGYDVVNKALSFDEALRKGGALRKDGMTADDLTGIIKTVQANFSSGTARLASKIANTGGGGLGSKSFSGSEFYRGIEQVEYKKLLHRQILDLSPNSGQQGFSETLGKFIDDISINSSVTETSRKITIGKTKIIKEGDEAFEEILKRFSTTADDSIEQGFLSTDALKSSIENTNRIFEGKEFQAAIKSKAEKGWNSVLENGIPRAAAKVLKTKKANFEDFADLNNLSVSQKDFLIKRSAQRLGINLKDANGREVSNAILAEKLGKRGLDTDNLDGLRSFLVREKQIGTGILSGGFNAFGLKAMTLDEGVSKGLFAGLGPDDQIALNEISKRMALADPTTTSSSVSVMKGLYTTRSGNVLDFSGLKNSVSNIGNFLANDLKIPIVNFNPARMFGKGSFDEMSGRTFFQIEQGKISQPFLPKGERDADFFLSYGGGRSKSSVMSFKQGSTTGEFTANELEGFYRPLSRRSNEMLSRAARNSALERKAKSLNEIEFADGKNRSNLLKRLGVTPERELALRQRFDVDYEQPNSVGRLLSRFAKRKTDPENPAFFGRLLKDEAVEVKGNQFKLNFADDTGAATVRSPTTGQEMISEGQMLRAFENFRKQSFANPFPRRAMQKLEDSGIGLFNDRRVSSLNNIQDTQQFARQVLDSAGYDAATIRKMGYETDTLYEMGSRIRNLLEKDDLLSGAHIRSRTPTILTREDALKDELFKYLIQRNELLASSSAGAAGKNFSNTFIELNNVLTKMAKDLPPGQLAEAQAAGLATLFNISSMRANRAGLSELAVQRGALRNATETLKGAEGLLDPFITGSIQRIGEVGKSGLIKQALYPRLSTSPYRISEAATDVLGSTRGPGTDVLLVPTFGTVFAKNPYGAIKSALGINTYSSPESYSNVSAAVSHSVERLNKYFGTIGLQLDVSPYGSPLSLFTSGMVGKRVLPLYGAGLGVMTVDRTIGGMVNEKDDRGERVYSPFFIGGAAKAAGNLQALGSGITPGGMNFQEKKEQLFEGEVAVRQGRFWPLGNTPFMGGKIMYYRPSIYRKLEAGAMFTSDSMGSPIERALFHTDISPLRPLDPYRYERKHFEDRPYPVSGEYFSGPFGPLVPALNATVGKILKPQTMMHEQEVAAGLANYAPAGQSGAYNADPYINGRGGVFGGMGGVAGGMAMGGFGGPPNGAQASSNAMLAGRAGSLNTARNETRNTISGINNQYMQMAYGPPKVSGIMPQRIVPAGSPLSVGNPQIQAQEIGYRAQEMLGIYGFAASSVRESFGLGQRDFTPQRSVLQSASKAYGTGRQFWDLNLGGLGDVPMLGGGQIGSIEFSEITRRFIPKERSGVDYINPIKNTMGRQYPFLPGSEYFTDFTTGDPFAKVPEGELRLPGVAYERLNRLSSDASGRYGVMDQYKILGDVAPYSKQFRSLDKTIDSMVDGPADKLKVQELRERAASLQQKKEFTEYKYKNSTPEQMGINPNLHALGRMGEMLAHRDTFINKKFINKQTATEDWERNNVYGTTFPEWQRPFESFIEPMINKAGNRNPIAAATTLAVAGTFFGETSKGKLVMSTLGAVTGFSVSSLHTANEAITGEQFIPRTRKKELALEEYADILTYTKNTRLAKMASMAGDKGAAFQYESAAKRTMYGAPIEDINSGKYGTDIESLSLAIPKRKREHFKAMINAPVEERKRILNTAGRLERRIYEAAWGMEVEKRPELTDYFARHELPDENWEGWHPNTSMDQVKIKIGQSMGLEMSQMGYYPQQIQEASLSNPSYPRFGGGSGSQTDTASRLRSLMSGMGVSGSVIPVMNPFGSEQIDINAGVR